MFTESLMHFPLLLHFVHLVNCVSLHKNAVQVFFRTVVTCSPCVHSSSFLLAVISLPVHTSPKEILKEIWDVYDGGQNAQFSV